MRTDKEFHLNGLVIAIVSNCAKPEESKVATRNNEINEDQSDSKRAFTILNGHIIAFHIHPQTHVAPMQATTGSESGEKVNLSSLF